MQQQYKNKEWLIEQYCIKKLQMKQICELSNVTKSCIRHWIKKNNIQMRPTGAGFRKINIDKDFLYQKYFIEKLSCPEIAKIIGCNGGVVESRLTEYGLKLRNESEASKLMWDNGRINLEKRRETLKNTLDERKKKGIPHWAVGKIRTPEELEFRRQQMLNNNPMNDPVLREKARINLIASNARKPRRTWESMFGVEGAKERREFFREFNKKRNAINNPMHNKESRRKSSETKKKNWKLHPHKPDCKCASCKTIRGEANKFPARSHNVFMGVNFLSKNEYNVAKQRFKILGIVPIQGVNCHMPVNGCSIDFYDLGCYNEYHPMNTRYDGQKKEDEYFNARRKLLDDNGHKKDPLIHVTTIRDEKEVFLFLSKIFKNDIEV